jgi:hypothetical protein
VRVAKPRKPKKPKYVPPEYVPIDPSTLTDVKCKGGPLKHVKQRTPIPEKFDVLDAGTYLYQGQQYVWVPNPDSPTQRFLRSQGER